MPIPSLDDSERRRLVDEYHRSGLSMVQFGARHHLNPNTLNSWVRKFRDRPPSAIPGFIELRVPDAPTAPLRIRPDGRRLTIEVPPNPDFEQLRALVDALC